MDKRELYFDVERTDSNTVTLIFNNPQETKLAFRAVTDMSLLLRPSTGISLQAKPIYAIILDERKGGWAAWTRSIMPYVTEVKPTERYRLTLIGGKISNKKTIYPICVCARAEETPWD